MKLNGKRLSNSNLSLRSLSANYSLEGGNLLVRALRTEAMGGVVHAEFSAERLTAVPAYQLSLSAEGLSLEEVERIAQMGMVPLRGTAHLQASAHWTSTVRNAIARADAAISASIDCVQSASNPAGQVMAPVAAAKCGPARHLPCASFHTHAHKQLSSQQRNNDHRDRHGKRSFVAIGSRPKHTDLRETDLLIASMRRILNAAGQTSSSGFTPASSSAGSSFSRRSSRGASSRSPDQRPPRGGCPGVSSGQLA